MFVKNIQKIKQLHSQGLQFHFKSNEKSAFLYATGVGKSKQAVDIMWKTIYDNKDTEKIIWYLVYFETSHLKNWKEEFEKWKASWMIDQGYVNFVTYASLAKVINGTDFKFNTVNFVLDEAHHALAPTIYPVIRDFHKRIILLSATLSRMKQTKFKLICKDISFKEYSLQEAIADNVLPKPNVFKINVESDDITDFIILKKGGIKANKINQVVCNFSDYERLTYKRQVYNLKVIANAGQILSYYNKEIVNSILIQKYNDYAEWSVIRTKRLGLERKNFISKYKVPRINPIIKKLTKSSERGIIFCCSLDHCDELNSERSVHSKKTGKVNDKIIDDFQNKVINNIYAYKKLREGMNFSDIDYVIIGQLDKETLSFIQMLGRGLRSVFPKIYVCVFSDSDDEKYWEECKKIIGKEFVTDYVV